MLLEAGPWDRGIWIKIPLGFGRILTHKLYDWGHRPEPEPRLDNRTIECARGKVIGGSSSINAMAYMRGDRYHYDDWAKNGLPEWSFAHLLPYFKRQESWEKGETSHRGGSGPLKTRLASYADPLVAAYMEAGRAAGHPATDDYNGAQQEGFAVLQSTIHRGLRFSAADAYLRPALARANLTVIIDALATQLVLEGKRAVGVRYQHAGATHTAHAAREVILAGGTINSPQLLMLSGIGDPDHLHEHGIAVKLPLPGVGRNLQDDLSVGLEYTRAAPGPFVRNMRADRLARELVRSRLGRGGFASDLPSGWVAFLKTRPEAPAPEVQLLFRATPYTANPYFLRPFADGFACRAVLARPASRGSITLHSADPRAPVCMRWNMLDAAEDLQTMRRGLRLVLALGRSSALRRYVGTERFAASIGTDDAALDALIRSVGATAHHPLGTCKMGPATDPLAVVDSELKVHGTEGLRVVDASVMPSLVGAAINAPVMVIAEKASDLIRGRAPLAPALN